jgi:CheY-like chemotaxis protein
MASKLIMIVEDSQTDMRIAEKICSDNGYKTVTVREGDKVLSTAIEKKPDLILLDVILPNQNGFQVCTRGRCIDRGTRVRDRSGVPINPPASGCNTLVANRVKFVQRKEGLTP